MRQLFEAEFRASSPERAEQLLAGAAAMARGVFDAAPDPVAANDVSHAQLNGRFWFTVNLSEQQPLLIVVDDAHWADAPSLRFLAVLARRLVAGVDSLTAAERRVAELAAQGMRNREIAETLFVTLKTVEVHLGRAYSKLDIRGRSQLAQALGIQEPAAVSGGPAAS